jgi:hypothetical protein
MTFTPPDHEAVRAAIEVLQSALTAFDSSIAAAVDRMGHKLFYDSGTSQWPIRPNTSGTNQTVEWWGPSTASLPNTGTSTGGTRASAPFDQKFLS